MVKTVSDSAAALRHLVRDGMTVAVGGFGLCGMPSDLITALRDSGAKDLTIISNNMGIDGRGLSILLENHQVRKVLGSYVGESHIFADQYLSGEVEVEFVPQGTLAARMRAGGAGIPAFYTPTGVGTAVAEGKEEAEFDGRKVILERAIVADLSLVHAHTGDSEGNLRYRLTAKNFNPLVAMCGKTTVAEVEVLSSDYLPPDDIDTPGVFVDRLYRPRTIDKFIEKKVVRPRGGHDALDGTPVTAGQGR